MGYIDTFKNLFKDKNRKKENLVLILILLVVILVSMNYIFKEEKEDTLGESNLNENIGLNYNSSEVQNKIKEQNVGTSGESIENKISNILSQISGISNVSVVINYSNSGNQNVIYHTKETRTETGIITSLEKSVAYDEKTGQALVSRVDMPTVEGVIVVASGVNNVELKNKIANALGTLLGIESYRVQVFER